jgi:hypothetical protein
MRPGWKILLRAALVAPGLLIVGLGQSRGAGDEPGRFGLGRLFRFGGGSSSASSSNANSIPNQNPVPPTAPMPTPPDPSYPPTAATLPTAPSSGPATDAAMPSAPATSAAPRIVPRPRVSRAVTESDPIVTRIMLNRSDDGNQFGMFLQVFADGTLIDSEGVHNVGQEALRPIIEALQAGDLSRQRGHCGAPATDSLESVHVIVYERSLGRLRANAFSYSGNPRGCDNAIRQLHSALDNLQARVTRPMTQPTGPVTAPVAPPAPFPTSPGAGQNVIPLTAPN